MFGRKKEAEEFQEDLRDRLVVIDMEKRTSDIVYVTDVTDVAVQSRGSYAVPVDDCDVFSSRDGSVYVLKADTRYIKETKRLAALEQSIVLSKITHYKPEQQDDGGINIMQWVLVGLLFVAIIAAAF